MDRVRFMSGDCDKPVGNPRMLVIADLTSEPERFEDTFVEVSGHYYQYFEHSAIYSTTEQRPYSHKYSDGIWLSGVGPELGGMHVTVSGIFSQKVKGHLGQWPGTICVTSAIETLEEG